MNAKPSTSKPRRTRKAVAPESGTPNLRCIPPISDASHDLKLTPQEAQLIRDSRVLNAEKKSLYFDAIHDCAMDARSQRPTLRVVKGGAA